MSIWGKILGSSIPSKPWEVHVTYDDQSTGKYAVWAESVIMLLSQMQTLLPRRPQQEVSLRFVRRDLIAQPLREIYAIYDLVLNEELRPLYRTRVVAEKIMKLMQPDAPAPPRYEVRPVLVDET